MFEIEHVFAHRFITHLRLYARSLYFRMASRAAVGNWEKGSQMISASRRKHFQFSRGYDAAPCIRVRDADAKVVADYTRRMDNAGRTYNRDNSTESDSESFSLDPLIEDDSKL